jgi:hypothetical protein
MSEPTRDELLAACRVLVAESLGDWVYSVRDRALQDDPTYFGISWQHPRVKAFSDAAEVIERFVKANPEPVVIPPPDPAMGGDDV